MQKNSPKGRAAQKLKPPMVDLTNSRKGTEWYLIDNEVKVRKIKKKIAVIGY